MSNSTSGLLKYRIDSHPKLLRRVLLSGALALTLYFGLMLIYGVPHNLFFIRWGQDGRAIVVSPASPDAITGPAGITGVQRNDVLVSVNGVPFTASDLYFRFGLPARSYTYEFQRGEASFWARFDEKPLSFREHLTLWMPLLVAVEAWVLGALVVLFAPAGHKAARLLAASAFGLAICLVADRGAQFGIAGSRLALGVLAPISSAGYIHLAFFPELNPGGFRRTGLRLLDLLAGGVALATMIEVLALSPASLLGNTLRGTLLSLNYAILASALLGVPVIMGLRAWRSASPGLKRQLIILALGCGMAVMPTVFLELWPLAFGYYQPFAFEDLSLPLLGLIPATFGYVILRHRYLDLDYLVVRSAVLIVGLSLVIVFFAVTSLLIGSNDQAGYIAGLVVAILVLLAMFASAWRLRAGMEALVFGPSANLDKLYQELALKLARDPSVAMLTHVLLDEVAENLHLRQAALLLHSGSRELECTKTLGVKAVDPQPVAESRPERPLLRQVEPEVDTDLWQKLGWAHVLLPVRSKFSLFGYVLYGAKMPDSDPLNAREVRLLTDIVSTSAIALENIRLVESLRDMSRHVLGRAATERMMLASRLHDEPLQRSAAIAYSLARLLEDEQANPDLSHKFAQPLREIRQLTTELREICAGLRPRILDQGLSFALGEIVNSFRGNAHGMDVQFQCDLESDPPLSGWAMEAIYHVAVEALNNVRKHADASRVEIRVKLSPGWVNIQIVDDGRGLGVVRPNANDLVRDGHLGLAFLFEWAEIAGGRMDIGPGEGGRGTRLELSVPAVQPEEIADPLAGPVSLVTTQEPTA